MNSAEKPRTATSLEYKTRKIRKRKQEKGCEREHRRRRTQEVRKNGGMRNAVSRTGRIRRRIRVIMLKCWTTKTATMSPIRRKTTKTPMNNGTPRQ